MVTREEWLVQAKEHLRKEFFNKPKRALPPKVAISCGIPKGSLAAIGQCWDPKVSSDGTTHVFICPSIDQSFDVLHVLLHELCHAVVGVHHGHNGTFGRLARVVGLEGKLTHTRVSKDSETGQILTNIENALGEYPHKAIDKIPRKKKANKPKRVTLVSSRDPSYKLSIRLDLLETGFPLDPWSNPMEFSN